MNTLVKIDKFVYVLVSALVLLSLLTVVVFRAIFSSILVAYGPPAKVDQKELRVDKDTLSKALEYVRNKEVVRLNP